MTALAHFRAPLACVALAACMPMAHASFTTTTSQSTFMAGVTTFGTDTFDNLAAGELGANLARAAGSFSYSASSIGGLFAIGASDRWMSNDDRRDVISFAGFGQSTFFIGANIFATNEGGSVLADQSIVVTVTDVLLNQSTTTLNVNSSSTFFGVMSSVPLLTMTIGASDSNLLAVWPTVNNLVLAVPEPASYALFAAGLLAIGAVSRRRSNS